VSTPDPLDLEAIPTDLYAREINASIEWIWDGGFHVTLGAPTMAEGWAFGTIRDAVAWLRDEAMKQFPR
jgi:hypothetical protein